MSDKTQIKRGKEVIKLEANDQYIYTNKDIDTLSRLIDILNQIDKRSNYGADQGR